MAQRRHRILVPNHRRKGNPPVPTPDPLQLPVLHGGPDRGLPADVQLYTQHGNAQNPRNRHQPQTERRRVAQDLDRLQRAPRALHDQHRHQDGGPAAGGGVWPVRRQYVYWRGTH
uniref:(northern house mosquito) hypothetical protein n=1 Tax=Culex pipiens TaxID=7175 RepID=A0A8D8B9Q6_CULPI